MKFEKTVPFDPGYSDIAFSFANEMNFLTQTYFKLKNPNQKRFELMKIEKSVVEIINKATSFYLGCMLWGGFIHFRFKNSPLEITGNNIECLSEEEKENFDCAYVVKDMLEFIKMFDRDCKYYLKHSARVGINVINILNDYIEFAELNGNFLETKTTADVKLPQSFMHFDSMSEQKLDELCEKIYSVIESKDIGKILDIGYFE